ncbi:MAG: SDR family NAD(P)-dependent oxidoreductase [Alphaproteobacteria bacterium]
MTGRVAIVTGGTTGIGLSTARALIDSGHRVAVGARGAARAEVVAEVAKHLGAQVLTLPLDVADRASCDGFVAQVTERLGPPTILVNSAGVYHGAFLNGHDEQAWTAQIDINLSGPFRMTRAVYPAMVAAGWGRIANIASTAGTKGAAGYAGYCASKAGLIGLSEVTAVEGAPHGISCIAVSPTWVETPTMSRAFTRIAAAGQITLAEARAKIAHSNPQGRIVQPGEVAALIDFFCSDLAPGFTNVDVQINAGADW